MYHFCKHPSSKSNTTHAVCLRPTCIRFSYDHIKSTNKVILTHNLLYQYDDEINVELATVTKSKKNTAQIKGKPTGIIVSQLPKAHGFGNYNNF